MFRDIASWVRLNEEIEVAWLMVTRDGSIGSDDFFGRAIGLREGRCDGDMLADWQTEYRIQRRKFESVTAGFSMGLPAMLMFILHCYIM